MANLPENGKKCNFEDCTNFADRSAMCGSSCFIKVKVKQDRTGKCFKCGAILVINSDYGIDGGVELKDRAGYGSRFDDSEINIFICDDCIESTIKVDRVNNQLI